MKHKAKTAVILFNLGGPDKLSSVKPFLFNLFNDKQIINLPQPLRFFLAKLISSLRNKKAQKIYQKIGGKSPLLEITEAQAHSLEHELSFFGDYKVLVAMRYWYPRVNEVIKDLQRYQVKQVILLPLYPQYSTATTLSSLNEFKEKFIFECKKNRLNISLKQVCCYFKEEQFILSHAKQIKHTIGKHYDSHWSDFRFLFSAHGLPQKLIDEGDPYVYQIEESSKKIVQNLVKLLNNSGRDVNQSEVDYKICYQSKVGPARWTGPSLELEIRRCAIDKKIPIIVPISFVSEHSETLVELDIDYKELAMKIGIKKYLRVPALNVDGHFIKSLAQICLNAASKNEANFSGCKNARQCPSELKKCGFAA